MIVFMSMKFTIVNDKYSGQYSGIECLVNTGQIRVHYEEGINNEGICQDHQGFYYDQLVHMCLR